jgi:uncharacterized protein (TIGR00156 family)
MLSKIKNSAVALAVIMSFSAPAIVHAQYVGPSTQKTPLSVADVLKNPVDDQDVVLSGFLIKKVGNEKYIFSDGTGEIRVEIEAEDFPAQKIDAKTRIEIRGEVEKEFLDTPEIDVKRIRISL